MDLPKESSASMGDLHPHLRSATKALHRELDHHPLLAPLFRDTLTCRQYSHALMALHGIYAALEAAVDDPATAAGFNYAERRKVPALEADLRALGQGFHPCKIAVTAPSDMGTLVGMLYPLEGSTLGARAICRQLARSSVVKLPMRYFSGYGEATLVRWEAFWDFAQRVCPPEAIEAACAAAAMTFHCISRHLDDVQNDLGEPK